MILCGDVLLNDGYLPSLRLSDSVLIIVLLHNVIALCLRCVREGDGAQQGARGTEIKSSPFKDDFGAFISYFTLLPPPSLENQSDSATLAGLTFAVKDM